MSAPADAVVPRTQGVRKGSGKPIRLLALVIVSLAGWQLAAMALNTTALPTLPDFVIAAVNVVGTSTFWYSVGQTLLGWAIGLVLSACVAIPVGLLIGNSIVIDKMTRIPIDILRAVPLIVLTPLVVLQLGATTSAKVFLIFVGSIWHLLIQTSYGAREVDSVARQTAISYHLTRFQRVRFLYLPSAAPFIATGLRLSAIVGLLIAIGVELITGTAGLGLQILTLGANARSASAFVYFIAASILGLVITLTFRRIERAALFWHPRYR